MRLEFRPEIAPARPAITTAGDRLEATFLAEMLRITIPDMAADRFGGGAGESHFASFMIDAQAEMLARRLDLGLTSRLEASDA